MKAFTYKLQKQLEKKRDEDDKFEKEKKMYHLLQ